MREVIVNTKFFFDCPDCGLETEVCPEEVSVEEAQEKGLVSMYFDLTDDNAESGFIAIPSQVVCSSCFDKFQVTYDGEDI